MNNSNKESDFKKKSNPILPCLLSATLPGAGQIYSGDYKRGILYLSVELFSWLYRDYYNNKTNDYVKKYKNYANNHWSFTKWIKDATIYMNEDHPVHGAMTNSNGDFVYPWQNSHHIEYTLNGISYKTNATFQNGSSTQYVFGNLYNNLCENAYNNGLECNTDYFNDATVLKDHHFFEGLGKYNMFFAGWDDTEECVDTVENESNCSWIITSNDVQVPMSSNKYYYQHTLRSQANKNSDYAENALKLIFINHAVSFFDSFITNFVKGRDLDFNYFTVPIYDFHNEFKLKGINLSISW